MFSDTASAEVSYNTKNMEILIKFGTLHDLVSATSLKYDISYSLDSEISCGETFDNFVKASSRLHEVINCSKSVKFEIMKLYASVHSKSNNDLVFCVLDVFPNSDLGEVFVRAFTPAEYYRKFNDFQVYGKSHVLLLPAWLADKVSNNSVDCLVVNSMPPPCEYPAISRGLITSVSNLWNPYDEDNIFRNFSAAYKAALKIENLV